VPDGQRPQARSCLLTATEDDGLGVDSRH